MMITPDTIITGIFCNRCGNELPPHTAAEHLDADHPVHECPHDYLLEDEGEDE